MGLKYQILHQCGLALFTYGRDIELSVAGKAEVYLNYLRDPGFDPGYHMLVDHSACRFLSASLERSVRLSVLLRPLVLARSESARTAIYAPEAGQYGVSRQYQIVSEAQVERPLDVFRTREECFDYLGLSAPEVLALESLWPGDAPLEQDVQMA